ncbi:MAG: LysR substrate-binding domain-containing protein [Pigmentiphaga sp.]|uniref:LysR family transcriptional regulator n=1 Tax=Pigmentiphaga sp. TaxID=1977564 RepID=UPI0029BEAF5C|nr:LysR substrate-binding domain-containing protein [Pigmentiphaga sp.]MDX3904469.1 LysR substrate-binding domain-containing protein [Pigmentiphaga sp.]
MNLRALKRFLAIAELGSINKAAAHLNVSQPSLTKDLQELEEALGVALFTRTARGVSLTAFGETIYTRAKLVDAELRKLENEARALREVSMGEVNVGVVPGFLQNQVLPKATLNLARDARRLTVNYQFGHRSSMLGPLLRGDLDFAIVGIEDDEYADELVSEPLFPDRNALFVRSDHPILGTFDGSARHLADYPWLVLSECSQLEQMLRRTVRAQGTPFAHNVIRTDSFYFFRSTLVASDCIGLTRYDSARLEKDTGNVVELPLHASIRAQLLGTHTIGIVYRRDTALSIASQALIKEIRSLTDEALELEFSLREKNRTARPGARRVRRAAKQSTA